MPRYTNPSDYLLKLATDTRLVSADLSIEELVRHADKSYAHYVKEETTSLSKLKASSLKSIKTVRGTHFAKQFKILLRRYGIGLIRVPLALFALFGMAIFSVFMISSIF